MAPQSEEALAEAYKAQGNDAFGRGAWEDAEARAFARFAACCSGAALTPHAFRRLPSPPQSLYSSALEVAPDTLPARAIYYANRAAARLSLVRLSLARKPRRARLGSRHASAHTPGPLRGGGGGLHRRAGD